MAAVFLRRLAIALALLGLSGCGSWFFYPTAGHRLTPAAAGLDYRDVSFEAPDGVNLHGWFLPADPARATVLFAHGNAGNVSTHLGSVHWLPPLGFNVLTYDYRGYGRSQGEPDIDGALADTRAALRQVRSLAETRGLPLIVFGQSLGGALVIRALADEDPCPSPVALVVESSFADYRAIAREKFASLWLTWPLQYPLAALVPNGASPLPAVSRIAPVPLLIVHGSEDRIVPPHHALRLFAAAREPKALWIIEGGDHIAATASEGGRAVLLAHLEEFLARAAPPAGACAGQAEP